MNQKEQKIIKLIEKGLKKEVIAWKIGYGGNIPEGIKRIEETICHFGNQKQN